MMQTEMIEKGVQFISLERNNKACRVMNGTTPIKFKSLTLETITDVKQIEMDPHW